jgi:hypothetical protein
MDQFSFKRGLKSRGKTEDGGQKTEEEMPNIEFRILNVKVKKEWILGRRPKELTPRTFAKLRQIIVRGR